MQPSLDHEREPKIAEISQSYTAINLRVREYVIKCFFTDSRPSGVLCPSLFQCILFLEVVFFGRSY